MQDAFSDDEDDESNVAASAGHELQPLQPPSASSQPQDVPAGAVPPSPSGTSMPVSSSLLGSSMGSAAGGAGGAAVLGTSPPEHSRLNAPGRAGEQYFYQECCGAWMFLHPLNLK